MGESRVDKVPFFNMAEYERMAIGAGGILSMMTRTDGEIIYLDEYELRLNEHIDKSLADIVDKHLAKEISDDKFENLIRAHEYAELRKRDRSHGK